MKQSGIRGGMSAVNYYFTDHKHRERFDMLIRKWNTGGYKAAVFLLTANEELWNRVRKHVYDYSLDLDEMEKELKGLGTQEYVLFHGAMDLYGCGDRIRLLDLSDNELLMDETLALVLHALVMKRQGIAQFVKKGE